MKDFDLLVAAFAHEGVERIFGVPGKNFDVVELLLCEGPFVIPTASRKSTM